MSVVVIYDRPIPPAKLCSSESSTKNMRKAQPATIEFPFKGPETRFLSVWICPPPRTSAQRSAQVLARGSELSSLA